MKTKIKFAYTYEAQVSEEEMINIKKKFEDNQAIPAITEHVNEVFLAEDGREETGTISDFEFTEVK